MKIRASEEVAALIAKIMADCDALKAKYSESEMPAEEVAKLESMVGELESLQGEQVQAVASERMEKVRVALEAPARPAPRLTPVHRERTVSAGEGLALWMGSFGPKADRSPEATYRARTAGIEIGNNTVSIPVDYDRLNFRNRTIMSKGGSGSGAELVWAGYSDKVVEYLTYFSPILGLLDSETTSDGNARTYFKIDDTSMESAYTSAGGGSETVPTIPDVNLSTANQVINVFDITSGYQKISFNELRDSYIKLEGKIAKANSNSHSRKLEREILTATGNGSTGVQGVVQAATALSSPAAWTQDVLMDALTGIPQQYRKGVIFASNDTTKNEVNKALRDDIGKSLFETTVDQDQEWDTLFGHKWYVSSYIAANQVLVFVPEFYMVRFVGQQLFQQFTERFWPNVAWAGIMSFGGAYLGPTGSTGTCKKITLA